MPGQQVIRRRVYNVTCIKCGKLEKADFRINPSEEFPQEWLLNPAYSHPYGLDEGEVLIKCDKCGTLGVVIKCHVLGMVTYTSTFPVF